MNKKFKRGALAAALVGIIATGGTLAYFTNQTGEKANVFTMGSGVSAELKEPTWDADPFTNELAPGGPLGKELANNFYPGLDIPKDPAIKNTSESDIYVAIKLDYKSSGAASDFATLDKFININFDNTDWTLLNDNTTAYYRFPLGRDGKTSPLFDKVTIDPLALTAEQVASTQYDPSNYVDVPASDFVMSDFEIIAKGYVVQADGFINPESAFRAAFPAEFQ